jgi:hypothetical protein
LVRGASFLLFVVLGGAISTGAQEAPYFVTYTHQMEEPGNLEVAISNTAGVPRSTQPWFVAPYVEVEYGITGRWTTELYLEGQARTGDSAIFTGWRLENRFRLFAREHRLNPVLYFEYEGINEGSRILKEVVGNASSFEAPNAQLRRAQAHELETKLILSSGVRDWNIAENFIVEKNLSQSEGFEFGYAIGAYRPLARLASGTNCRFCRENFTVGAELYGDLGSTRGFGLHDTAHYAGPVMSWQLSDNAALHLSPAIGLNHGSNPLLLRFGYSFELKGLGMRVSHLFGGR